MRGACAAKGWEDAAGENILHHPPCGWLVPLLLRKEARRWRGAGQGCFYRQYAFSCLLIYLAAYKNHTVIYSTMVFGREREGGAFRVTLCHDAVR